MKKLTVALIVVLASLINASFSYAFSAMGGRILNSSTPGVECYGGSGPMNILPIVAGSPASYVHYTGTPATALGPTAGGQFKGLYTESMVGGLCWIDSYPYPISYPVFMFTPLFGGIPL